MANTLEFKIPEYSLSFTENALYIAEAIEEDFVNTMKSIGIEELAIFESTGSQVVYEDGEEAESGNKSFKEKFVKFFQDAWEKIKKGFQAILTKINELKGKIKGLPYSKITKEMVSDLNDYSELGELHRGEKYDVDKYFKRIGDLAVKEPSNDTIAKEVCDGKDVDSLKGIANYIYETEFKNVAPVTVTKEYLLTNFNALKEELTLANWSKDVKIAYNAAKKNIDGLIKEVKQSKAENAKVKIAYLKNLLIAINFAKSGTMSVSKARFNEVKEVFRKLMTKRGIKKVNAQGKTNAAKAAQNNAYTVDDNYDGEESTKFEQDQLSLIESLFKF